MTNEQIYTIVARVLNRTRYSDFSAVADSFTAMIACDLSDALRAVDPDFDAGQFHTEVGKRDRNWDTVQDIARNVKAGA